MLGLKFRLISMNIDIKKKCQFKYVALFCWFILVFNVDGYLKFASICRKDSSKVCQIQIAENYRYKS